MDVEVPNNISTGTSELRCALHVPVEALLGSAQTHQGEGLGQQKRG